MGQEWKALPESDKAPFIKLADKDKARYEKEMKNYTPPSAPPADEDDDEEDEDDEWMNDLKIWQKIGTLDWFPIILHHSTHSFILILLKLINLIIVF